MRLVDTNILIYAASPAPDEADKQDVAQQLLEAGDVALSVQVLQEFYYQATRSDRPAPISRDHALRFIESIAHFPVQDVTLEELAQIFSTADTWADVRAEWPRETIQRFIPGTDSGTFDYFVEVVFDEDKEPILSANPQLSEDDNVLVQGIKGSPYAIGFFGYAYYDENRYSLNILSIDGIDANEETTGDGSYPLARPLYIYSDAGIMMDKPQVNAFINFYLTQVNDEIVDTGYFPASGYALSGAIDYWRIANELEPIGDAALDLAEADETEGEPAD